MNFDLRLPIGIMFTIFGAMLVIFGLVTSGNEMYAVHSLGTNINLIWGFVLLIFGVFMLVLALRAKKSGPNP
jgi:hypothetical protein